MKDRQTDSQAIRQPKGLQCGWMDGTGSGTRTESRSYFIHFIIHNPSLTHVIT